MFRKFTPFQTIMRTGRKIVIGLAMLLGLSLAACQSEPETFTVGIINLGPVLEPVIEGFKAGMTERGYIEGENITYIYSGPVGDVARIGDEIEKIKAENVDMILSVSTPVTLALKGSVTDTPIVFVPLIDAVKAGVVDDIIHPGGNITGVQWGVLEGRRLEWLLEVVPSIEQIYIPYNPDDGSAVIGLEKAQEAAAQLGVELITRPGATPEERRTAVMEIPEEADALYLLPDNLLLSELSEEAAQVATEHNLPTSVPSDTEVQKGFLMAYSFRFYEAGSQASGLADLILKGEEPSNLPVETAEPYLIFNLQAAAAIGVEIDPDFLEVANEIIR